MGKKTKGRNKKGKVNVGDNDDDDVDDYVSGGVVIVNDDDDEPRYFNNSNKNQNDGSESYTSGRVGRMSMGGGGGSDTLYNDDDDDDFHLDNDDDDDDMEFNDRIIQRGDPGDESMALRTSHRLQTIRDAIRCLPDIHSNQQQQHEMYIRRCYKLLSLYGSSCGPAVYDILASNLDGIIEGCLYGLSPRSSSSKQYAVCRLIEVISIVLCNHQDASGSSSSMDHWVTTCVQESLRPIIVTTSRSTTVRMAALRALSVTIYLAHMVNAGYDHDNDDPSDSVVIESLLDLYEMIATKHEFRNQIVPLTLRATAWDCWTLLACTLDDWTIAGQDEAFIGRGVAILGPLQQALEETKLEASELRTSAAECLAMIHEARINLGIIDDDAVVALETNKGQVNEDCGYDNENIALKGKVVTKHNSSARRYQKGSWDNSKQETLMDEVKQRIAELANESSHRISKKEKKEQRSTFREYMSTIVDDESPELVIKYRNNNGQLELSSWKEIIPLNCLRNILQSGFQTHLLSNPAIQQLFHVSVSLHDSKYNSTMSQLEKRLLLSKNSETYKNADQDRRKKRDKRQNIKNHFLTADGDDL